MRKLMLLSVLVTMIFGCNTPKNLETNQLYFKEYKWTFPSPENFTPLRQVNGIK